MFKITLIAAGVAAALSGSLAWWAADAHWQQKWDTAEQGRLKTEIQTVTKTVYIEREAAKQTAAADAKGQKELQDAKIEIQSLRTQRAAGTLRLRQQSACTDTANGAARTDTGMDTERPAEQAAGAAGAEQHILNLGEHALSAIAQRDACVDILKSDRAILSRQ